MSADSASEHEAPSGKRGGASASVARCAAHPGADAASVCERCGDFACADCARGRSPAGVICAGCESKGAGDWIPEFEARGATGFVRTVLALLRAPLSRLGTIGGGPIPRALVFAIGCNALLAALVTSAVHVRVAFRSEPDVGLRWMAANVLGSIVLAIATSGLCRVLGRRAPRHALVRAALYGQALPLAPLLLWAVAKLSVGGDVAVLVLLSVLAGHAVIVALSVYRFVRRACALRHLAAAFVATTAVALSIASVVGLAAGFAALARASVG